MAKEITFDPVVTGGVVAGFDGSDASRRAVAVAAEEAAMRGAPLHVVRAWMFSSAADEAGAPVGTVPSLDEVEQAVRASVDHVVQQVRAELPDLQVVPHVQHCKAVDALVSASRDAQLLVVARRGQGGFVDLLLGSTADQVVRHAHCSVLVVRPV
ncbi:MAG TPA: universal stress protein [Angustibacter sp.]|nr:universal stress protein [Angustibacter sp.]